MKKQSAGLLVYRLKGEEPEVFLVHPGGPFWKNKDAGAWSIPKGELEADEDALACAIREFTEETGTVMEGDFTALNPITQKGGKDVYAWAVEGDVHADSVVSNTCFIEWPPRSGKQLEIPEVDKGGWFKATEAKEKINPKQAPLIDELVALLSKR
ncbi:MAG: NUDIX domain-containing protein [Sphingobacteriales bacterium]|nr:MAG: NUDIX domain-containing protein [Sphingobacteriales bacterium]